MHRKPDRRYTRCNALLVVWFNVSISGFCVNWLIPKCIAPKAKLNRIDSVSICPSMDFNPWWVKEHIYLRVRYCWDQVTRCNALLVAWFTVSTSGLIVYWLIPKCIAPKAKLNRIDSVSICPSMDWNPWWVKEHIYLRVRYCWDQVTRCNALLITWFAVSTSGLIVYWFIPKCIAPTKKVTDSFQPATSFKPNIPNWEFSKKSYDLWAISYQLIPTPPWFPEYP